MSTAMSEALIATLKSIDDGKLSAIFAKADSDELALALRLLPIERSNILLASVPPDLARRSLALVTDDAEASQPVVRRLMKRLEAAQHERHAVLLTTLDWLARLLGRFRRETAG